MAATVSSMTALSVGVAVFFATRLTDQARLRQESSLSIYAAQAEQQRLRLEYIRIAVAILTAKPTDPQREMRRWAVEVLNKSAEVQLSDEQSQRLINGTSVLYGNGFGTDYGYGNGYGTDYGYGPPRPQFSPAPAKTP